MRALIGGSGRCGTTSLAAFLDNLTVRDGERVVARHETDFGILVQFCLRGDSDAIDERLRRFDHDFEVSPLVPFCPRRPVPEVLLLAIIRDGCRVVSSGMDVGWGTEPDGADGQWVGIHRFPGLTRFERCCQQWAWTNERLATWGASFWRLEDLACDAGARARLGRALGLSVSGKPFPTLNDRLAQTGLPPRYAPYEAWSAPRKRIFARVCGKLMDKHYPGWRERE